MLKVKVFMNSAVEEILSFKCCGLHNQNFEMHVDNLGDEQVTVQSRLILENESTISEYDNLFPPGWQKIPPGTGVAFYCSMDESEWTKCIKLTVYDDKGNSYQFDMTECAV